MQTFAVTILRLLVRNTVYYWLRSGDNDGRASFSKIVIVKNEASALLNLSPNPVQGLATLQFVNIQPRTYRLSVYNLAGNTVL